MKNAQTKINQARDLINSGKRDLDTIRRGLRGFDRDHAKLMARIDDAAIRIELLLKAEK